jgi:uncharacterized membrane protein YeiH
VPVSRDRLLTATDLRATGLFAVEGSLAAAAAHLDLFGVAVIGFITALGGGMIRDVLLGDTPPAALRSREYPLVAAVGAGAVIVVYQWADHIPGRLLTGLDAGGLALFAVTGAAKALAHQLNAISATLLGIITGCGGGILRDVLLNEVPTVLRAHIHAVAAALGAALTVLLLRYGRSRPLAFAVGALACVAVRMISVELDWNLPQLGR